MVLPDVTHESKDDLRIRIADLERQLGEAQKVIAKALKMPAIEKELGLLGRGIGTKTDNVIWLELQNLVAQIGGE